MAGGVFLWESVMQFVFPTTLGVGRFLTLGIPVPEIMAPIVGVLEIVGGTLFILGLCTRLAALPLLIDIVVAIASTKIPLLLGTSPLPPPPVPPQVGFWAVLHEIRADDAQLLCSLFLLLVGAGPAAFFRDACRIVTGDLQLEATTHVVAHLVREIEGWLRDVIESVSRPGPGSPGATHEAEVRAALSVLGIPESDPIAQTWLDLTNRKSGRAMHARAHRTDLGRVRGADAD